MIPVIISNKFSDRKWPFAQRWTNGDNSWYGKCKFENIEYVIWIDAVVDKLNFVNINAEISVFNNDRIESMIKDIGFIDLLDENGDITAVASVIQNGLTSR